MVELIYFCGFLRHFFDSYGDNGWEFILLTHGAVISSNCVSVKTRAIHNDQLQEPDLELFQYTQFPILHRILKVTTFLFDHAQFINKLLAYQKPVQTVARRFR